MPESIDAAPEPPAHAVPRPRHSLTRLALLLLTGALVLLTTVWGTLAVYYSNLPAAWQRASLSAAFAGLGLWACLFPGRRRRQRLCYWGALAIVIVWWLLIPASNHRDWNPDVAVLSRAEFAGDEVTVRNIRNSRYRSAGDYRPEYYDKTFDLATLRGMDLAVSHFSHGPWAIGHTFICFRFAGGEALDISIEVRKERGETYSPLRGLFKQYELIYVIGDERDIIGSRANCRGEELYLYPMSREPSQARALFVDMLEAANELVERPQFYNTIFPNCTTSIVWHLDRVQPRKVKFDWRLLLNGYSDELAYQRGALAVSGPWEEVRKRHRVPAAACEDEAGPDYSRQLRAAWPPQP